MGSVGNVSMRSGKQVVITPTQLAYSRMRTSDLVTVDLEGRVQGGRRAASRELPLHLGIYAARADAQAIVHTHSPYAAAWSFLAEPLPALLEEQAYYGIGKVPVAPPARPGSPMLAELAVGALGDAPALLLGRHGVIAWGNDCQAALVVAEVVERTAQVAWLLRGCDANRTMFPAIDRPDVIEPPMGTRTTPGVTKAERGLRRPVRG